MLPHYCRRTKQSGYVLVLSVILLGLFLSLAAAAIDMGNLYVWQLRLDKAVRAGALAGIGYRTTKGWTTIYGAPAPNYSNPVKMATSGSEMEKLLATAHDVVKETFRVSFPASITNWASVSDTVDAHLEACDSSYTGCSTSQNPVNAYNPVQDKIDLYYRYEVPTFFAGKIKGMFGSFPMCAGAGNTCLVKTHQTAQLDYANIIMLLDVSGSIQQQGITQTLKDSATAFYQIFNPFRDRISVIEFNLGASTVFSFAAQLVATNNNGNQGSFGSTESVFAQFTNAINGIAPQSNTNPCDALIAARSELNTLSTLRSLSDPKDVKPFLVFFTDGAPNAFRGIFQNMTNWGVNGNPPNPGSGDWYQYAIEWVDPSKSPSTYQGPSPLIKAGGTSLFNLTPQAKDPPDNTTNFTNGNDYCGDIWSNNSLNSPDFFEQALNGLSPSSSTKRPGCLTNLDFSIPGGSSSQVISLPAGTVLGETDFHVGNVQKSIELPYYCAIEAADQIRVDFGGTIFAIGLGSQAGDPQCNDPLQNATDYFVRKDNFLSRLAFDPYTVNGTTWKQHFAFSPRTQLTLGSNCSDSRKGTAIPVGYNVSLAGGATARAPASLGATNGQYFPTNDPTILPGIFSQVAKQILLRLNS